MSMKPMILSVALAFSMVCLSSVTRCMADDGQTVEQAATKFYASLNQLFSGDADPMEQCWSHADDVTYMGPAGGFQIGWDQVRDYWRQQAALKLGGKIAPFETRVTVGNDLAFVQCFERGDNLDAQGNPLKVSIRATTIFRKENGQWKVIGHQTESAALPRERNPDEVGRLSRTRSPSKANRDLLELT